MTALSNFVISCLLLHLLLSVTEASRPYYDYKRYSYSKKKTNERKIRNMKQQCESRECNNVYGLDNTKCVRKCMSEFCYSEIYSDDELEEGEIDVRYDSFKGCVIKNQS
jgi:hypothetical protein